MDSMKSLRKMWESSLSFLDNHLLNSIIVFILILYCSTIFDNINAFFGKLYNFSIVKLVVLLLVVYVSPKDTTIAILLAISYLVSMYYSVNETFVAPVGFTDNSQQLASMEKEMTQPSVFVPEPFVSPNDMENKNQLMMNREMTEENVYNPNDYVTSEEMTEMKQKLHQDKLKLKKMKHEYKKEHFFPMMEMSDTDTSFDTRLDNVNMETKKKMYKNVNSTLSTEATQACMDMYVPQYEAVGNVCEPTATYKGELNAQGMNFPEGFDFTGMGSPI
jgi:hypothetical protein